MAGSEHADNAALPKVRKKKHKRSSSYIPNEILFDQSDLGSVEDEDVKLPKALAKADKKSKKKKNHRRNALKENKADCSSTTKSSTGDAVKDQLKSCEEKSADMAIEAVPTNRANNARIYTVSQTKNAPGTEGNITKLILSEASAPQSQAITNTDNDQQSTTLVRKQDKQENPTTLNGTQTTSTASVASASTSKEASANRKALPQQSSQEAKTKKTKRDPAMKTSSNIAVAPKFASAFQKYNISKRIQAQQPSKEALLSLINSRFHEMDLKHNTIADVYKVAEDFFVVKLSDASRKIIRRRLVDLCSQQAMEQANDTIKPTESLETETLYPEVDVSQAETIAGQAEEDFAMEAIAFREKTIAEKGTITEEEEGGIIVEETIEYEHEAANLFAVGYVHQEIPYDEEEIVFEAKPKDESTFEDLDDKQMKSEGWNGVNAGETLNQKYQRAIYEVMNDPNIDARRLAAPVQLETSVSSEDSYSIVVSNEAGWGSGSDLQRAPIGEDHMAVEEAGGEGDDDLKKEASKKPSSTTEGRPSATDFSPREASDWSESATDEATESGARRRRRPDPSVVSSIADSIEKGDYCENGSNGLDVEPSVLCFHKLCLEIGRGTSKRSILRNITGLVRAGKVLSVIGSPGAGKTTLLKLLSLQTCNGNPSGTILLNGCKLTDIIFKTHGYFMRQEDRLWETLTCRESLMFAARCYEVGKEFAKASAEEVGSRLGLGVCMDRRIANLTSMQRRILSVALALLKRPALLLLDEPMLGLHVAAASKVMTEVQRQAVEYKMIVIFTTHKPSSMIRERFDQMLLLSDGRQAFFGSTNSISDYFGLVGYPCPLSWTPPEFYLALLCPEVSDETTIEMLLQKWQQSGSKSLASDILLALRSTHRSGELVVGSHPPPSLVSFCLLARRYLRISCSDSWAYNTKGIIMFFSNLVIAIVYWNARDITQEQSLSILWMIVWFHIVPCTALGVGVVTAFSQEFEVAKHEIMNGMYNPLSYGVVKVALSTPLVCLISMLSIGVPCYVIQQFPSGSFFTVLGLSASSYYAWESIAECISVWFFSTVGGRLGYAALAVAALLCSGIFLPPSQLFWPIKLFYYVLPLRPYTRSVVYAVFIDEEFISCLDDLGSPVCVNSTLGVDVLEELGGIVPVISSDNHIISDFGTTLVIAACFRVMFVAGIAHKASRGRWVPD